MTEKLESLSDVELFISRFEENRCSIGPLVILGGYRGEQYRRCSNCDETKEGAKRLNCQNFLSPMEFRKETPQKSQNKYAEGAD